MESFAFVVAVIQIGGFHKGDFANNVFGVIIIIKVIATVSFPLEKLVSNAFRDGKFFHDVSVV